MNDTKNSLLLQSASMVLDGAERAKNYLAGLEQRHVAPAAEDIRGLQKLREPLPERVSDPAETLALLDLVGSPATVASAAGRFFGLVVGGTVPAAAGARVLTTAWDQVVFSSATSPVGVELERIAEGWLKEILGLPIQASASFVTGTTMGTVVALAAARHKLLERSGWNAELDGLWNAPQIRVVASEEVHVTVKKALSILGMGSGNLELVPTDAAGAMDAKKLPTLSENTIVLTQAGNVNSGAMDPFDAICDAAAKEGAWVHVDGAFGLWAAAKRELRKTMTGYERADSWVTDGHKWLNTPYDCGMVFCKHPQSVHAAMATVAPYLQNHGVAEPKDMVPEFSRSARGVEVWAALRSLGREGVEKLVSDCCNHARLMASLLEAAGFKVLNPVSLNQVVATLPGKEDEMGLLAQRAQSEGTCWFGPTVWKDRPALRFSISSWVTRETDIHLSANAILRIAREMKLV